MNSNPTAYIEFLGARTPLNQEEAEALRQLWQEAKLCAFHFQPVPKGLYCESQGRLGCDCLPCSCPKDFLEEQKHLSRLQQLVNRARAACADWLELAARRIR